jgi:PRTRC genetic system ThiF family protein
MIRNFDEMVEQPQVCPLVVKQCANIELIQVGAGGTGSWLFPHLVRITRELNQKGRRVSLTLIDPDTVSPANITRQNFAACEVGRAKAHALALRYTGMWGVEIRAVVAPFNAAFLQNEQYLWHTERLVVVVGCVDNAAARREIGRVLEHNPSLVGNFRRDRGGFKGELPRFWVLDCGNYEEGGQVLLGSTARREDLTLALDPEYPGVCLTLPSPYIQHPELLEPRPEELPHAPANLSCAELADLNAQSLTVNAMVAAVAADTLVRMLVGVGNLKRFASYFYLPTGTLRSRPITSHELAKFLP